MNIAQSVIIAPQAMGQIPQYDAGPVACKEAANQT